MKKRKVQFSFILLGAMLLGACSYQNDILEIDDEQNLTNLKSASIQDSNSPNILLIIADDMGHDATPGYPEGEKKPVMPNLESLISSGVIFDNVWAAPVCTPTRATILTGKYGKSTGVIAIGDELPPAEESIFSFIENNSPYNYASTLIGKWHLGGSSDYDHPGELGVNNFSGFFGGGVNSYWRWNHTMNGTTTINENYTTSEFTDLAIDWIGEQEQPWFLWLAYNAPHMPFHAPDGLLHSQGDLSTETADINADPLTYYIAMIEAMDTEMGRLLASMSPEEKENTVIIFIGDNGSPDQVAQVPYSSDKAKGTLYQGGVNVPMIVSGAGVLRSNERETGLVNSTDLFATIADLAGCGITSQYNSISFKNAFSNVSSIRRRYNFTEIKRDDVEGWAIQSSNYKLIEYTDGSNELYYLSDDPYEEVNLLLNPTRRTNSILNRLQALAGRIKTD